MTTMTLLPCSLVHLFLALAFLPSISHACGGFFCEPARPVVQSGEAIVFGVNGNEVTMHVQILYQGPAEGFSWLLPIPVQPDDISVGSDLLFTSLFQQTLPRWELQIVEDPNESETCSAEDLEADQCAFRESMTDAADEDAEDGAVVLEQGSVGPFDYVVLEAADNNPSSVLEWLNDNGYDQPEGSAPLLNYYAVNNHVFVALRLQKQAETGEIQPLILKYTMPVVEQQVSRRMVACVPIQLTSIAATDNMPIQVYILEQARATPLNFVELELDDTHVDWLGCLNNPSCYDADYRARFDRAASQLTNHSFVTEFAGPHQELTRDTIAIDVTQEEIASVSSMDEFFDSIRFRLPFIDLVDTIVNDYSGDDFDAAALALELEDKVLKPARDAQAFVDGFPYLTRLWARLSPESMNKDPFFTIHSSGLPNVDNVHRATAIPLCADNSPSGLTITVDNGGGTVTVPATRECGVWRPTEPFVWSASQSAAVQLTSYGYQGEEAMEVIRLEDGSFDSAQVAKVIDYGDSLVMNQTIPEYDPQQQQASSSGNQSAAAGTIFSLGVVCNCILLAWNVL